MLLEFRVTNFRSIQKEQVFSLVPEAKDSTFEETNVYPTGVAQLSRVLRTAVVYGPNASGKSNLLLAMTTMQSLIRLTQAGQALPYQPFAFDPAAKSEPTQFEVTVFLAGVRYQYGFSFFVDRIVEEWLLVYKSSKPQEWFARKWNAESGQYQWDFSKANFQGAKDAWRQATRDDALFLTTAIQLNNEQLKPLWTWFTTQWAIMPSNAPLLIDPTLLYLGNPSGKQTVLSFLNAADLGIADLGVVQQKQKQSSVAFDVATGKFLPGEIIEKDVLQPVFTHTANDVSALFGLFDESQGTQRFFAMTGLVLMVLQSGATLIVDELENSLHPLLVQHLVSVFQSTESNAKGAQLVFSTHNTTLLDKTLFRRDQVWFMEKGSDLGTSLYSLAEFQGVRKDESFEKRYLEGRYGAIPILRDFHA